ncbi:MAG: hypothetical protein MMC23_004472 [Stictis urceolatum]|nr:hypothetical protein [Stictis urceolata]
MPKTIGSLIPWVIHSRMLDDFEGLHYMKSDQRDAVLTKLGKQYGFGKFRGRDGKVRLGLEYKEYLLAEGESEDLQMPSPSHSGSGSS